MVKSKYNSTVQLFSYTAILLDFLFHTLIIASKSELRVYLVSQLIFSSNRKYWIVQFEF